MKPSLLFYLYLVNFAQELTQSAHLKIESGFNAGRKNIKAYKMKARSAVVLEWSLSVDYKRAKECSIGYSENEQFISEVKKKVFFVPSNSILYGVVFIYNLKSCVKYTFSIRSNSDCNIGKASMFSNVIFFCDISCCNQETTVNALKNQIVDIQPGYLKRVLRTSIESNSPMLGKYKNNSAKSPETLNKINLKKKISTKAKRSRPSFANGFGTTLKCSGVCHFITIFFYIGLIASLLVLFAVPVNRPNYIEKEKMYLKYHTNGTSHDPNGQSCKTYSSSRLQSQNDNLHKQNFISPSKAGSLSDEDNDEEEMYPKSAFIADEFSKEKGIKFMQKKDDETDNLQRSYRLNEKESSSSEASLVSQPESTNLSTHNQKNISKKRKPNKSNKSSRIAETTIVDSSPYSVKTAHSKANPTILESNPSSSSMNSYSSSISSGSSLSYGGSIESESSLENSVLPRAKNIIHTETASAFPSVTEPSDTQSKIDSKADDCATATNLGNMPIFETKSTSIAAEHSFVEFHKLEIQPSPNEMIETDFERKDTQFRGNEISQVNQGVIMNCRPSHESSTMLADRNSSTNIGPSHKVSAASDASYENLRDDEIREAEYFQFITQLFDGVTITKHNQNSRSVAKRKLYITNDLQTVYWTKWNSKKIKKSSCIMVKEILDVKTGMNSKTFRERGVSDKAHLYLSVEAKQTTLNIEADNVAMHQKFVNGFTMLKDRV